MTISTQFIPTSSGPTNLVSNTLRTVGKLAVVSMVLPCALVFAQSADNIYPAAPTSGGIVGLGVASLPKYQGSDQTQIKGVPILEYHWANGIFVGGENDTLIGFQCTTPSNVQYGTALGVDEGRKESHSSALAGMGNVSTKAVLVSFV
ncbi:MAG: MipA/OmpV family protein, partial [Undibacterium sp.]|nr:MipA/OmpV family protein [Undibacterium sp.]